MIFFILKKVFIVIQIRQSIIYNTRRIRVELNHAATANILSGKATENKYPLKGVQIIDKIKLIREKYVIQLHMKILLF